jgi:hypothetical protein
MTPAQFYARLLALLQESGLSKAEKIELLEHAVEFVHEEDARGDASLSWLSSKSKSLRAVKPAPKH